MFSAGGLVTFEYDVKYISVLIGWFWSAGTKLMVDSFYDFLILQFFFYYFVFIFVC